MTADRGCTVIRGARIFDGERLQNAGPVLLADGIIAGVGPGLGVPAHAEVTDGGGGERGLRVPAHAEGIDGGGRTLLPGLIDCHVHAGDVRALSQALTFGITTELDMFSGPDLAAQRRSLAARRDDVADIRTSVHV